MLTALPFATRLTGIFWMSRPQIERARCGISVKTHFRPAKFCLLRSPKPSSHSPQPLLA